MSRQGKITVICILGFLLIVVLGFYSSRSRRSREELTGTDAAQTGASISVEEYKKEQDTIMAEMMKDMDAVGKSGSASVDFLTGMVSHHQSAVAMAESYIKHGAKDEELKKLASDMMAQQSEEIEQMKAMAEALQKEDSRDEEAEAAYLEEYESLMAASHTGHGTAQNIDWAFAEGMIIHHQMAVDMAGIILKHIDDSDVEKLAQNIIDLQKKEIEQMNDILERLG